MKPFSESSYLAQVRRLRRIAEQALSHYPIHVKSMRFIHHGENTTFCVEDKSKKKYLVRVHRNDYHTLPAIREEIAWMRAIQRRAVAVVPNPVRTSRGQYLIEAQADGVPGSRPVSVLHWIEGRFIHKRSSRRHIFEVGRLVATLQKAAPACRHRRYWTAEGMIGSQPKFGSIDKLSIATSTQQKLITARRLKLLKRLREYERKFPHRRGMIHADLHFGNLLITKNGLGAIDFDDSGYGILAYDLAVVLLAIERQLNKTPREIQQARDLLISGYRAGGQMWDHHDDQILDDLVLARKIMMLGWLNSRIDNPRLAKHLKRSLPALVKELRRRV
jgi:Ser/Thr protein kinase RdoA (MazF antagonist)